MSRTQDTIDQGFAVMRLVKRRNQLDEERDTLDLEVAAAVAQMRADGATWDRVAVALGVTRQAAHQRYNSTPVADTPDSPPQ